MVMMTSMALTRETERGTMENLLAMPASPVEIMLGKILPYLVVGAVQVVVVLTGGQSCCSPCRSSARCRCCFRRDPRLRHGAGAARLHDLDGGAHADAGDAADLLLLPAVDPAVGLHVPLSRHARLGAGLRRDIAADAFPADHPRGDAEGRRFPGDGRRDRRADDLRRGVRGLALFRFRRTLD